MTTVSDVAELEPTWPGPGLLTLAERGLLPDALVRLGIRRLCAQRLREERVGSLEAQADRFQQRIEELRQKSDCDVHRGGKRTALRIADSLLRAGLSGRG